MSVDLETILYIKKGSAKRIRMGLKNQIGGAMDLTTATAVSFRMRRIDNSDGVPEMDRAGDFVDPRTSGIVEVTPIADDVSVVGHYFAEWEVTFPGGPVIVPENADEYIRAIVQDTLG